MLMLLATRCRALLLLGLLGLASGAAAQAPAPLPTKIKVYLVGTFHFNASTTDVHQGTAVDMTTPANQRELAALVDKLQRTQADKVCVEWMPARQRFVDSTYALYRRGQRPVGSARDNNNEVVQVGYRLASQLHLSRVYCVDADGPFDYAAAQAYATAHGQEAVLESAFAATLPTDTIGTRLDARLAAIRARQAPAPTFAGPGLLARYARMNTARYDEGNLSSYLLWLARVGGGPTYAGADLGGDFFKRNVRIYTNLLRTVDVQRDRAVVLLIGSAHVTFLKAILRYNPLFEVVDVVPLLTTP